jgi:DNA mismatch repair ATPase MutL
VRFNLIDIVHTPNGSREDVAIATSATSTTLQETVSSIIGQKFLATLAPIHVNLDAATSESATEHDHTSSTTTTTVWGAKGLISKNPQGEQPQRVVNYYSINGRPVELPSVTAVLRKAWQAFGGKKKASCILAFTLPNDAFDINLSPDKRAVLLTQENEICQAIQEYVTQYWNSQINGVFQIQQVELAIPTQVDDQAHLAFDNDGRRRHKRRGAFIHDLSQAKMQHEHEERHDASPVPMQGSSPAKTLQEACLNHSKLALGANYLKSQPAEPNEAIQSETGSEPKRRRISDDQVSDMERRKWTEIQSNFQSLGEGNGQRCESLSVQNIEILQRSQLPSSQPAAVRSDDELPENTALATNSSDSSQEASVSVSNNGGHERIISRSLATKDSGKPSSSAQKPLTLEQFGFKPFDDKGDRPDHNTQDEQAEEKTHQPIDFETGEPTAENVERDVSPDVERTSAVRPRAGRRRETSIDIAEKKFHESDSTNTTDKARDGVTGSSKRKPKSSPQEECDEQEGEDDRSEEADSAAEEIEVASDPQSDSESPEREGAPCGNNSSQVEASVCKPVVVWDCFKGTQAVARAARLERLAMQQRKRLLHDVRSSPRRSGPIDNEAAEAAKTVTTDGEKVDASVISLSKEQFRKDMQIIGQFNLGFILARCHNNHLWILDQHACDEKFNFEHLCRTTVLHEQKLLAPMSLELSAAEEACILDHMPVFEANGFRFAFDPQAPSRRRLSLTALPHSGAQDGRKAVQFGKDDVSALCAILSEGSSYDAGDGGTGTDGSGKYGNNAVRRYASTSTQSDSADRILARLPKAIAMFASRACRTSIMIGTSLSHKEMEKVVQRLADMEHPWSCAHGRPTMRHVGNVLPLFLADERKAVAHIAGPTATVLPMTQDAQALDEE